MFYNLEILPRDSVQETTGKTMQAGHVGGTPLMVSELMGKAKGGVLMIDGKLLTEGRMRCRPIPSYTPSMNDEYLTFEIFT